MSVQCILCFKMLIGTFKRMLRADALGRPRGTIRGGRREGGSGWGTRVHPWWTHVDVWQNRYNTVK